jgi:hypothetical protein
MYDKVLQNMVPFSVCNLELRMQNAKRDRWWGFLTAPYYAASPANARARLYILSISSFDWCGANIPRSLSAPSQVREEHSRKDILAPEAITQRDGNCSLCAWMAAHHSLAQQRAKRAKQTPSNPSARAGSDAACVAGGGAQRARARKTLALKRARKVSANC